MHPPHPGGCLCSTSMHPPGPCQQLLPARVPASTPQLSWAQRAGTGQQGPSGQGQAAGQHRAPPATSLSLPPSAGVPGGLSGSHTAPEPGLLGARLPVPDLGPVFQFAAASRALVTAVLAAWHCRDGRAGPGALSTRREAPPAPCHLPWEREVPGWLLWHRPPPGRALLPPCCAG